MARDKEETLVATCSPRNARYYCIEYLQGGSPADGTIHRRFTAGRGGGVAVPYVRKVTCTRTRWRMSQTGASIVSIRPILRCPIRHVVRHRIWQALPSHPPPYDAPLLANDKNHGLNKELSARHLATTCFGYPDPALPSLNTYLISMYWGQRNPRASPAELPSFFHGSVCLLPFYQRPRSSLRLHIMESMPSSSIIVRVVSPGVRMGAGIHCGRRVSSCTECPSAPRSLSSFSQWVLCCSSIPPRSCRRMPGPGVPRTSRLDDDALQLSRQRF